MAYLGIDIGCISLKSPLVGTRPRHRPLLRDCLPHHPDLFQTPRDGSLPDGRRPAGAGHAATGASRAAPPRPRRRCSDELFAVLPEEASPASASPVRAGGSSARRWARPIENEFKAIARGLGRPASRRSPPSSRWAARPRKFIRLDTDCTRRAASASPTTQTNGDCAAGTGSFMDQQASRLLYDIEDVGGIVLRGRQGGQHRRPLQRVRQERHDPRPAEGLRAARGAARPLRRRHPQLQGHHHQGQGHRAAGGVHRRRGGQPGRRAGRARGLRLRRTAQLFVPPTLRHGWAPSAPPSSRPTPTAGSATGGVHDRPSCRRPTSPRPSRSPWRGVRAAARHGRALRACRPTGVVDAYLGIDVGSVSHQPGASSTNSRRRDQGDLHQDRRAAGRGGRQGPARHPGRVRRPHPRARRGHHRLRPRAHRRAHRRRHRHRRDHRPQDGRRLHRPQDRPAGATRSSRSAARTPSSSACRTASSSTSP